MYIQHMHTHWPSCYIAMYCILLFSNLLNPHHKSSAIRQLINQHNFRWSGVLFLHAINQLINHFRKLSCSQICTELVTGTGDRLPASQQECGRQRSVQYSQHAMHTYLHACMTHTLNSVFSCTSCLLSGTLLLSNNVYTYVVCVCATCHVCCCSMSTCVVR